MTAFVECEAAHLQYRLGVSAPFFQDRSSVLSESDQRLYYRSLIEDLLRTSPTYSNKRDTFLAQLTLQFCRLDAVASPLFQRLICEYGGSSASTRSSSKSFRALHDVELYLQEQVTTSDASRELRLAQESRRKLLKEKYPHLASHPAFTTQRHTKALGDASTHKKKPNTTQTESPVIGGAAVPTESSCPSSAAGSSSFDVDIHAKVMGHVLTEALREYEDCTSLIQHRQALVAQSAETLRLQEYQRERQQLLDAYLVTSAEDLFQKAERTESQRSREQGATMETALWGNDAGRACLAVAMWHYNVGSVQSLFSSCEHLCEWLHCCLSDDVAEEQQLQTVITTPTTTTTESVKDGNDGIRDLLQARNEASPPFAVEVQLSASRTAHLQKLTARDPRLPVFALASSSVYRGSVHSPLRSQDEGGNDAGNVVNVSGELDLVLLEILPPSLSKDLRALRDEKSGLQPTTQQRKGKRLRHSVEEEEGSTTTSCLARVLWTMEVKDNVADLVKARYQRQRFAATVHQHLHPPTSSGSTPSLAPDSATAHKGVTPFSCKGRLCRLQCSAEPARGLAANPPPPGTDPKVPSSSSSCARRDRDTRSTHTEDNPVVFAATAFQELVTSYLPPPPSRSPATEPPFTPFPSSWPPYCFVSSKGSALGTNGKVPLFSQLAHVVTRQMSLELAAALQRHLNSTVRSPDASEDDESLVRLLISRFCSEELPSTSTDPSPSAERPSSALHPNEGASQVIVWLRDYLEHCIVSSLRATLVMTNDEGDRTTSSSSSSSPPTSLYVAVWNSVMWSKVTDVARRAFEGDAEKAWLREEVSLKGPQALWTEMERSDDRFAWILA